MQQETTKDSDLHALLMLLIAQGIISGVLAHRVAVAANKDIEKTKAGFELPKLKKLALLSQGRNLIRSVHSTLEAETSLPLPVEIPMPYTNGMESGHFLMPHEYFAAMFEDEHQWKKTVLPDATKLQLFWESFQHHPAMENHPLKRKAHWKETTVPILLHGDEVPVVGVGKIWSRSAMSLSWMSLIANVLGGKGSDIVFYIFGVFEKFCIASTPHALGTMATIWKVLHWSFQCMYQGSWPSHDYRGVPYPKNSLEARRAGKPLAGKYTACLVQMGGDLDYFMKWLGCPNSTNHTTPCIQCKATYSGDTTWHDNRPESLWQRRLLKANNWRAHWNTTCEMLNLPGMNCWSIALDLMHNLYLGWAQHFFGSVMYLLTHQCIVGQPLENLKLVESFIRFEQKQDPTRNPYKQRLSKLSMFVKRTGFPKLKGRASDIRGLDFALWKCFKNYMHAGNEQHELVHFFLETLVQVGELMETYSPAHGFFAIPEPHCTELYQKGCQMAQAHVVLMEHYAALHIKLFNCTSKMHYVLHTFKLAKYIHPYNTWAFKGEAQMKAVQQLWKSCLSGNKHWNVGRVAAKKQRHLLHIKSQQ